MRKCETKLDTFCSDDVEVVRRVEKPREWLYESIQVRGVTEDCIISYELALEKLSLYLFEHATTEKL